MASSRSLQPVGGDNTKYSKAEEFELPKHAIVNINAILKIQFFLRSKLFKTE